jgi:hypothetical protein
MNKLTDSKEIWYNSFTWLLESGLVQPIVSGIPPYFTPDTILIVVHNN